MELRHLFLIFIVAALLMLAAGIVRFLPSAYRVRALAALVAWALYACVLGLASILSNAALRPPGIVYVFLPAIALVIFVSRSRTGAVIASSVPLWFLMGAQSVRLVVEGFLDRLWHAGLLPTIMTFHGGNLDIAIGVSAPIVAALAAARRLDTRVALAWNILGMLMLGNIIARGILSSPAVHVLSTDAPSAIGAFPFSFIPAFVVPLALVLHVLSIRVLLGSLKARARDMAPPAGDLLDSRRGKATL